MEHTSLNESEQKRMGHPKMKQTKIDFSKFVKVPLDVLFNPLNSRLGFLAVPQKQPDWPARYFIKFGNCIISENDIPEQGIHICEVSSEYKDRVGAFYVTGNVRKIQYDEFVTKRYLGRLKSHDIYIRAEVYDIMKEYGIIENTDETTDSATGS